MSAEELNANIDNVIAGRQQRMDAIDQLEQQKRDAQHAVFRYQSIASSSEDPAERNAAAQRVAAANRVIAQCDAQISALSSQIDQMEDYLHNTQNQLNRIAEEETVRIYSYEQSISQLSAMASSPFGGADATAQLRRIEAVKAEHERYLQQAQAMSDKIESALNSGSGYHKVLTR